MPDTSLTWITPKEAYLALDVAPATVYNMVNDGRLRSRKIPPFRRLQVAREDVVKILEGVD